MIWDDCFCWESSWDLWKRDQEFRGHSQSPHLSSSCRLSGTIASGPCSAVEFVEDFKIGLCKKIDEAFIVI